MLLLGLESTCDETAASVVSDGVDVLSSSVATQFHLHAKFRGVVPEIASRAHIENLLPVLEDACTTAGVHPQDLDAIAVAHRPGLIGSLLISLTAAKTLAWLLNKPLIGVDHVQAHLYSVVLRDVMSDVGCGMSDVKTTPSTSRIEHPTSHLRSPTSDLRPPTSDIRHPTSDIPFPLAGAVLSGGHTALYLLRSWTDIRLLGSTIDDAVGEAYDKVAALLGLPFPGGPHLARLAETGDPAAVRFPRSLFEKDSLDLSFSGLKTAVLYHALGPKGTARKHTDLTDAFKADTAASFQAAVLDVLEEKLKRLVRHTGAKGLLIGGGVASNTALRQRLSRFPVPVHFPEKQFCTDNAAMSAGLAHHLLTQGLTSPLDLDAITHSAIPV